MLINPLTGNLIPPMIPQYPHRDDGSGPNNGGSGGTGPMRPPTSVTCERLSCYYDCRMKGNGGGSCPNGVWGDCKCYPAGGAWRKEDNIWYELNRDQQQQILGNEAVEN